MSCLCIASGFCFQLFTSSWWYCGQTSVSIYTIYFLSVLFARLCYNNTGPSRLLYFVIALWQCVMSPHWNTGSPKYKGYVMWFNFLEDVFTLKILLWHISCLFARLENIGAKFQIGSILDSSKISAAAVGRSVVL